MIDRDSALKILEENYPGLLRIQRQELEVWENFVSRIPVGTKVFYTGSPNDVRATEDGRYYDDPVDKYVSVSKGGLWQKKDVNISSSTSDAE
jgi:hypothetical protein